MNAGRIRATIVDDYIFDRWQGTLLKIASTNRDVAVSQDGVLAWVDAQGRADADVVAQGVLLDAQADVLMHARRR